uniref:Uncharacterized protein n=1 Tax=Vespula pensylvanica TaxID=30213 RepID=A0A834NSR7_VESPE|nr:hypothetical protein H0235_011813 [Vespula pensylvanica]
MRTVSVVENKTGFRNERHVPWRSLMLMTVCLVARKVSNDDDDDENDDIDKVRARNNVLIYGSHRYRIGRKLSESSAKREADEDRKVEERGSISFNAALFVSELVNKVRSGAGWIQADACRTNVFKSKQDIWTLSFKSLSPYIAESSMFEQRGISRQFEENP